MKNTIWTLPTRLFHWLTAVGFATAYILSDFEDVISFHFAFGALVGSLLLLRIVFGLIGPRYSHFKDFPVGIRSIKGFITNFKTENPYVGHNPLASIAMLGIMISGVFTAISGYLFYTAEFLHLENSPDKHVIKEGHEFWANLFLALVIVHLLGVLLEHIFHPKKETLQSIFTGQKHVENAHTVKLNIGQKVYSIVWVLLPIILFVLALQLDTSKHKHEHSDNVEMHHVDED